MLLNMLRRRWLLSPPHPPLSVRVLSLLATFLERLVSASASSHQPCCVDYYIKETCYNTESLISNGQRAIAFWAGQMEEAAILAFEYGNNLGLAYQLTNDVLDFTGTPAILSRNLTFNSSSGSNFDARFVEKDDFDESTDGYDKDSGDLSFFGSHHGDIKKNKKSKFDRFDKVEDSDEELEDGEHDSDCDDNFTVLDSFDKNCLNKDDIRRVEVEEDELRHPLVREVCRLIELRSAWSPKHEEELRHLLRSLKSWQVCAVLRSQADERVALKFFYWADRQWRYRHDTIVYYVILEVLSKTKLCQGAKRVLRLMARRGINCRPEAFSYVMVAYSRAGKLRNAMQILTMMQKAGVKPDLLICNTAVHVLVVGNKLEKALRFVKRMQLVGITPNVVTYNSLIKGYCDLQCIEDAMELITEMPFKGCSPDKVSYFTVMGFLCKEKRIKEVRDLMEKMVNDSNLLHDQVTYGTLIHMLSKHGHGDEALEFLKEAEDKGFHVDKVAYSAIIHSFCKDGRIEEAKELSLCQDGKINEAKKFMEECLNKGCAVNVVNFTTVIHGFCQKDDLDAALSLLDDMYLSNKHPDVVTYTTIIDALGKKGRIEEATELSNRMLQKGLVPTAVTYRTIIHRYCQMGRVEDLLGLLEKMLLRQKCRTAYNQVIEKLCSFGNLEEADKLLSKVLRTASKVDASTCHVLMESYLRKGIPLSAYKVACRMFNRSLIPDLKLCEKVSKRLVFEGKSEEADNLMLRFVERGKIQPQNQEH
ncbi:hypothetical protein Pint_05364 [Pistacia integerrima]|uniref:Uncharacterized protein n=1 Tax=Pistacia integerrima TaxID=434235 RepID=A0ACC0Z9H8_9ROSI|nr:hypothetical protein Pint_05364 [Pistacia integerrima]